MAVVMLATMLDIILIKNAGQIVENHLRDGEDS